MGSDKNIEQILQPEVFHYTRLLRIEASTAQNAYNRVLQKNPPNYRDKQQVYSSLENADSIARYTKDIEDDVEELSDTAEINDIEAALDTEFEDAYTTMDFLESHPGAETEFEGIFIEPLETVREDYGKLKMSIVSSPIYREIEDEINSYRSEEQRTELQQDVYLQAERIGFNSSKLEEIFNRTDEHNIEAAKPLILEQGQRTFESYKKGIGLLRDVIEYRREHNLEDPGNFRNIIVNSPTPNTNTGPRDAEDVDLSPLSQSMENAITELWNLDRLPLEDDFLEEICDSEIISDSEFIE